MVMTPDVPGELCEDDSEVLVCCIKPSFVLVEAQKSFLFLSLNEEQSIKMFVRLGTKGNISLGNTVDLTGT